jgi:hypothetical protein
VQPNYLRYAVQTAPPNDQFWLEGRLWGLDRIQAQPAWNAFSRGSDGCWSWPASTRVINYRHPDLAANMWRNPLEIPDKRDRRRPATGTWTMSSDIDARAHTGDPLDDQGHGTLTAGHIAAIGNNRRGHGRRHVEHEAAGVQVSGREGMGTDAGAIECLNYIVGPAEPRSVTSA